MNILIFSWRGPGHPNAGGAEESTHQHAKGWVKAGHQVTLFTSYYEGAKYEESLDGVKIVRQGFQIFGVHIKAFLWFTFGDHQKYDLVIDEFHGIPFFTPLFIKGKKLAFIHEVTKEVWALNPWPWPLSLIPTIIGTIFEPLVFKLIYKKIPFMTVSESTKKDLMDWEIPEENISIIHNGFEKPKGDFNFPKEKNKTLIFLGALSKDKGINEALQIFSILNQKDENFQFWVVGRGESSYLKVLIQKTRKLKIDDKTKFWGFVSEEKKYELLSKAHILICPSVREGWGLVVIEAASVGTPTVAYNVAGLKDSIVNGKTGILSQVNVESLVLGITELLKSDKKYSRIRQSAIAWSKNFSWDKSVKSSLKLINDIVG